jgi:hypothetical protein
MDRNEIFDIVAMSADKFGARNPQQFKLLHSRLSKADDDEVFHGLLGLFIEVSSPDKNVERQELAGRLLEQCCPQASFDLAATMQDVLPNYELSVEQLPYYFAAIHGVAAVVETLENFESKSPSANTLRAIQTMAFWLRNVPNWVLN